MNKPQKGNTGYASHLLAYLFLAIMIIVMAAPALGFADEATPQNLAASGAADSSGVLKTFHVDYTATNQVIKSVNIQIPDGEVAALLPEEAFPTEEELARIIGTENQFIGWIDRTSGKFVQTQSVAVYTKYELMRWVLSEDKVFEAAIEPVKSEDTVASDSPISVDVGREASTETPAEKPTANPAETPAESVATKPAATPAVTPEKASPATTTSMPQSSTQSAAEISAAQTSAETKSSAGTSSVAQAAIPSTSTQAEAATSEQAATQAHATTLAPVATQTQATMPAQVAAQPTAPVATSAQTTPDTSAHNQNATAEPTPAPAFTSLLAGDVTKKKLAEGSPLLSNFFTAKQVALGADGLSRNMDRNHEIITIGNLSLTAPIGTDAWAIFNLLVLMGGVVWILVTILQGMKQGEKKDLLNLLCNPWMLLSALFTIVAMILFHTVQDTSLQKVWIDQWTIYFLIIFALEVLGTRLALARTDDEM
jgi:hypothetical protein